MSRTRSEGEDGDPVFEGVDLHCRNWHVTVRTEAGELFRGSIPGTWANLKRLLERYHPRPIHLVYEAGYVGFWSIQEWRERNSRAYSYAKKYKLVDTVSQAVGWRERKNWDERTSIIYLRRQGIQRRTEWARKLPGSYDYAQRRGIIGAIAHQAGLRPVTQRGQLIDQGNPAVYLTA